MTNDQLKEIRGLLINFLSPEEITNPLEQTYFANQMIDLLSDEIRLTDALNDLEKESEIQYFIVDEKTFGPLHSIDAVEDDCDCGCQSPQDPFDKDEPDFKHEFHGKM
jgi:hypothetical protein